MKAPAPNRWICFAIWALAWMEPLAAATVIAAEDDGPVVSDDISENLSRTENEEAVGGLVRYFREARRRLREKAALDTSLSYHTLGMAAVGGGGVPTAMSGDLTLQGVWKPGARWHDNATELHFRLRERHAIGDTAASALGERDWHALGAYRWIQRRLDSKYRIYIWNIISNESGCE